MTFKLKSHNVFNELKKSFNEENIQEYSEQLKVEARRITQDIKSKIKGSSVSWPTGINSEMANEQLANAITVKEVGNRVEISIKNGTHQATGMSYMNALRVREFGTSRFEVAPIVVPILTEVKVNSRAIGRALGDSITRKLKKVKKK